LGLAELMELKLSSQLKTLFVWHNGIAMLSITRSTSFPSCGSSVFSVQKAYPRRISMLLNDYSPCELFPIPVADDRGMKPDLSLFIQGTHLVFSSSGLRSGEVSLEVI
jgi:hypothetical protein